MISRSVPPSSLDLVHDDLDTLAAHLRRCAHRGPWRTGLAIAIQWCRRYASAHLVTVGFAALSITLLLASF